MYSYNFALLRAHCSSAYRTDQHQKHKLRGFSCAFTAVVYIGSGNSIGDTVSEAFFAELRVVFVLASFSFIVLMMSPATALSNFVLVLPEFA